LWTDLVTAAAIAVGIFFMFVASVGVYRLSDFYLRMHAPTKAATLGLMFLLGAAVVSLHEKEVFTKALLAVAFIAATAPVGAHILSRAAYRNDIPPSADTAPDEYAAVVQRRKSDPARPEPAHAEDMDDVEDPEVDV
jgi:multicomponent Na+:H+ antiporter subunit G